MQYKAMPWVRECTFGLGAQSANIRIRDWNVRNAIIEVLILRNPRTCPTPLPLHRTEVTVTCTWYALRTMAQESRCLGTAILFANIYRIRPNNLPVLPKVDEAEKDFRETFHALGFRTDVYRDLKMEEFYTKLADVKKLAKDKYVVFFFIGHGGDGDVLFMEDGREVETKEVVEGFASLPANTGKVFFIDACRGEGSKDTYCPKLPNSFLARSTLPHQIAHTKGTYGT